MADGSLEYRLGELTGELRQMRKELGQVRDEGQQRERNILDRIEQHDARDDDRFIGLGTRMQTIERAVGVRDATAAARQAADEKRQAGRTTWQTTLTTAITSLVAVLIGGLIELWLHYHP